MKTETTNKCNSSNDIVHQKKKLLLKKNQQNCFFFNDSQVESQNCLQIHICDFLHFFEASLKFQVIKEDTNVTELKTDTSSLQLNLQLFYSSI